MSVYLQRCKKAIGENNYRKFAQWLKKTGAFAILLV